METDQLPVLIGVSGSRTSTPTTVVRSRPRPPSMLTTPSTSPLPTAGGGLGAMPIRSHSIDQPAVGRPGGGDQLTGMLTTLGQTDFVGKYSRKPVSTLAAAGSSSTPGSAFGGSISPLTEISDGDVWLPQPGNRRTVADVGRQDCYSTLPLAGVGKQSGRRPGYEAATMRPVSTVSPVSPIHFRSGPPQSRDLTVGNDRYVASSDQPRVVVDGRNETAAAAATDGSSDAGSSERRTVNLLRSQSDSSSVRSIHLRSFQKASSGSRPLRPAQLERPDERTGCVETDDEGVGALDFEGPSFKEEYLSVTTPNFTGSSCLQQHYQQQRPLPLPLPANFPLQDVSARKPLSRNHNDDIRPTAISSSSSSAGTILGYSNGYGAAADGRKDLTSKQSKQFDANAAAEVTSSAASDSFPPTTSQHDFSSSSSSSSSAPTNNPDLLVRKNSKTGKPKSLSDPMAETSGGDGGAIGGRSAVDIPAIVYSASALHVQSSPVLTEDTSRFADGDRKTMNFTFIGGGGVGPVTTGDSASSLSDRESRSQSDEPSVSLVDGSGTERCISPSMHQVPVRVVLKSDDSFDGGDAIQTSTGIDASSTAVKPPRPRGTKTTKRPRAPNTSMASSNSDSSGAKPGEMAASSMPGSVVRRMWNRDRAGSKQAQEAPAGSTSFIDNDVMRQVGGTTTTSSLTLPLSKRTSLSRSRSSAGAESTGSGNVSASARASSDSINVSNSTSDAPSSSAVRRRSPGANEVPDESLTGSFGASFAPSASVPELYSSAAATTSGPTSTTTTTVFGTPRIRRVKDSQSGLSTPAPGSGPTVQPFALEPWSATSLLDGSGGVKDKRDLIMQEFYTTEQQYVEALKMLVERYMIPLKIQNVVDSSIVDDIFYKINEIYMHHATFLTFLARAVKDWDSTTTIGDIIEKNFSKQTVIESYMSFIEHFPRAEKVLDDVSSKSSFQKFIEQCERDTRTKLPLKAQIVKPAQRIPRYELLLKRLLDNTPASHPDYVLLTQAEKTIHDLALRINSVKESKHEEDLQETLKKIELLLITDLAAPDRLYLRHDMVSLASRKDQQYCLWLFNDLTVFSCVKRKAGSVSRRTSILLQSPNGHDFVENIKHKLWLKVPLECVEMTHVDDDAVAKQLAEKQELENDAQLLEQVLELSAKIKSPHQTMEEAVNEVLSLVNKQLAEYQSKLTSPEALHGVELVVSAPEGVQTVNFVFPSLDKKTSWKAAFLAARQKLSMASQSGNPPEFLQSLQITKTRAGMQFACASLSEPEYQGQGHPSGAHRSSIGTAGFGSMPGDRDVWVCNSDGFVGHMCLLSLQPDPIVTLNTPVPGCNSRITCICAVPPATIPSTSDDARPPQLHRRHHHDQHRLQHQQQQQHQQTHQHLQQQREEDSDVQESSDQATAVAGRGSADCQRRSHAASGARSRRPARKQPRPRPDRSAPTSSVLLAPHQRIEELREESEDGYASDSTTDSYSNNDDYDDDDNVATEADTEDQPSPSTEQPGMVNVEPVLRQHSCSSLIFEDATSGTLPSATVTGNATNAGAADDDTVSPASRLSTSSATARDGPAIDANRSTMWIGTDDGCVLIFPSSDNIKTTKNKIKIQQNAGVLSIAYLNERVYISIANGDIIIYKRRDQDGSWDCSEPELVLGASNSTAPINRMLPVEGRLWCACLNDVIVFNIPSHEVEVRFLAISPADSKRGIQCMTTYGQYGVWVAGLGSCKVTLFHNTTYEQLLEVSVGPAVTLKLQSADDIIRQHKTACLRITALLACKDQLWVGTSAGVIVTLPMPKLTPTTTKSSVPTPTVTGLVYGHTGHVRFLTAVELSQTPSSTPSSADISQDRRNQHSSSSSGASGGGSSTQTSNDASSPARKSLTLTSRSPLSSHSFASSSAGPTSASLAATSSSGAALPARQPVSALSMQHQGSPPVAGGRHNQAASSLTSQSESTATNSQQLRHDSTCSGTQSVALGSLLVISGGDGFEDFRPPSASGGNAAPAGDAETTGRDDSTNHLLIWKVT